MKHQLRNKIYNKLGLVPKEHFVTTINNIFNVLKALENFSKESEAFSNIVAGKLGIKYVAGKGLVQDSDFKNEKEIEEEYRERGMI